MRLIPESRLSPALHSTAKKVSPATHRTILSKSFEKIEILAHFILGGSGTIKDCAQALLLEQCSWVGIKLHLILSKTKSIPSFFVPVYNLVSPTQILFSM